MLELTIMVSTRGSNTSEWSSGRATTLPSHHRRQRLVYRGAPRRHMSYNVQRFPARRQRSPEGPPAKPRAAAKVVQQGAVHSGARRKARGGGNRSVM